MKQVFIPVLKGALDLNQIKPYNTTIEDGNTVAKIVLFGRERLNGEFSYPVYQDDIVLLGTLASDNMGVIPDHINIRIDLFINLIDKSIIDNKAMLLNLTLSVKNGCIYQTGKRSNKLSATIPVGKCKLEDIDDIIEPYDEEKEEADFIDPNLPYSRFNVL